jgi:hypothetical protein
MIQKKRRRRAVLNRVAPTTGRQAFRGMIQPLMLAGGASPAVAQSLGEMYANSIVVKPVENTVPTDVGKEPCPMTEQELEICQWRDDFMFCRKKGIEKNSKLCEDSNYYTPECPLTAKIKELCDGTGNYNEELSPFCQLKRVNGLCIDEYIAEKERNDQTTSDAAAADLKRRQQEANDNWVKTRGCSFKLNNRTPQQEEQLRAKGINPITTQNPCRFPELNNATPGDVITVNRVPWKFISWNPAEPPVITN